MKVGYIVALYFGNRRTAHERADIDKLYYLRIQLDQLGSVAHSLDELIFVFNLDKDEEQYTLFRAAHQLIMSHPTTKKYKHSVIIRENCGDYSYGAWDFALSSLKGEFDYCFLVEDDYAPYVDDFDKKFLSHFKEEDYIYICQLYTDHIINKLHCSISNGVINNKIYDSFLDEAGKGFCLHDEKKLDYGIADHIQGNFLNSYIENGYKVGDICSKYYVPFKDHSNKLVDYGNVNGEILLAPIWPPYFIPGKMPGE